MATSEEIYQRIHALFTGFDKGVKEVIEARSTKQTSQWLKGVKWASEKILELLEDRHEEVIQ